MDESPCVAKVAIIWRETLNPNPLMDGQCDSPVTFALDLLDGRNR